MNNMTEKKKPEIRFKGFTEDWEQRKLEDWGTFYYGHSCPKWSVTADATTPCIRYGELYNKFGAKIDRVFSYTNMPTDKLRFSNGTEVLIPRVGEDPMDYNHCTWLSMPDVAIGEMISVFNTEQNPLFAATMFNATLQKEFAMRVEGGSVTNLYFEKLKNIEVSFPKKEEQEKIARFFEEIDHLITLHQRKYDKLKILKKSMLEKMFPKNDRKVPEIRFSGFTDDWEQRKFSDLVIIERGGSPRPIEDFITDSVDGLNWVKIGDAPEQGNYITKTAEKIRPEGLSKTREVHPGDLILSNSMSFGKPYIMGIDGCIHDGWLAIREVQRNFDLKFLCVLLGTNQMLEQYRSFAAGSTVNNLNKELVGSTTVRYPNKDEQKQIGEYFEQLDQLITLHQRKYSLEVHKIDFDCSKSEFNCNTNTWEQRKLFEVAEFNPKSELPDKFEYVDLESVVGTEMISHRTEDKDSAPSRAQRLAQTGDVFFQIVRPYQRNNYLFLKPDKNYVFSTGYAQMRPKIDAEFLMCFLQTDGFVKVVLDNCTGTSYPAINSNDLSNLEIILPILRDEQRKIGGFVSNLDHLITLHQRKPFCYKMEVFLYAKRIEENGAVL